MMLTLLHIHKYANYSLISETFYYIFQNMTRVKLIFLFEVIAPSPKTPRKRKIFDFPSFDPREFSTKKKKSHALNNCFLCNGKYNFPIA